MHKEENKKLYLLVHDLCYINLRRDWEIIVFLGLVVFFFIFTRQKCYIYLVHARILWIYEGRCVTLFCACSANFITSENYCFHLQCRFCRFVCRCLLFGQLIDSLKRWLPLWGILCHQLESLWNCDLFSRTYSSVVCDFELFHTVPIGYYHTTTNFTLYVFGSTSEDKEAAFTKPDTYSSALASASSVALLMW